jgi:DNA-binding NarL/FixJ family response regulator
LSTPSEAVRVFLCDDVAELRVLMRYQLEEDPQLRVVGEAGDGAAGVAGVIETHADVVLLDLSMPGMDGLEVIRELKQRRPETGIVVFSGFSAAKLGPATIELGADRYLEKGEPGEVVRETLLEVARERGLA